MIVLSTPVTVAQNKTGQTDTTASRTATTGVSRPTERIVESRAGFRRQEV